jgi:hypothetical protein
MGFGGTRATMLRISESQVSAGLGIVLLLFFLDGFVRDATVVAGTALVLLAAMIIVGLLRIADPSPVRRIEWHAIATALTGTLLVATSARVFGISSVLAAALVGIAAGTLPKVFPAIPAATMIPLYVGAFAGMTSPVVLLGPQWLIIAGILTGCVWSIARDAWHGIGGKMGTIAFAGVAVTSIIASLTGNHAGRPSVPDYTMEQGATVVIVSVAAAGITHWLSYSRHLGPVLGSAVPIAVMAMVAFTLHPSLNLTDDTFITAWFGASLVGITHPARLQRRWLSLTVMSVVFAILLLQFQSRLAGIGGDSGATAAAAVIAVIGFTTLAAGTPFRRGIAGFGRARS